MMYCLRKVWFLCSLLLFLQICPASASQDSLEVVRLYKATLAIMSQAGDFKMDSIHYYADKGISLAKKNQLLSYVGDFNTNIAYAYKRKGEYEKAVYYSSLAYREALALNYISGIARSGYTHAMICFDKGDIKPSFEQIFLNIEFARKNLMNRYLFLNYSMLAHITDQTNNLLITEHYLEKAFEYHSDSTMTQIFRAKKQLSKVLSGETPGDEDRLYQTFRELIYGNKKKANLDEITLLMEIANAYSQRGNHSRAVEILEELLLQKVDDVEFPETSILANLAAIYFKMNQFAKAEKTNPEPDRSVPYLYHNKDYLTILKTDARLAEHSGRHREALKVWKEVSALEDSLAHGSYEISYLLVTHLKDLESLESQFEYVNKENTMQKLLLEKERREKVLLLILAIILIILCGWIYYLFRKLSVGNHKILEQNKAISFQTENLRKSNFIKDKLFSLMSHELRSPVAELITILDVKEWKDSTLHPHLENINRKAKNIYATLDNILIWSSSQLKNEPTEMKALDISEAMQTAIHLNFQEIKQKNIEIENRVTPTEIKANISYLMIIFRNILSNAVKFTPPEGTIKIYNWEEGDLTGVIVEDSGSGIESEKLQSLFLSVQDSAEGTSGEKGSGVGLILCKDLVDKLQGKIEISTNGGTLVKLLFMKSDLE